MPLKCIIIVFRQAAAANSKVCYRCAFWNCSTQCNYHGNHCLLPGRSKTSPGEFANVYENIFDITTQNVPFPLCYIF